MSWLDECFTRIIGLDLVLLLTCSFFTYSLDITNIIGEVTFDVNIPADVESFVDRAEPDDGGGGGGGDTETMVLRVVRRNMTVAPLVECQYQYPEKEHVDTILSNMMNELTKVFVKSHNLVLDEEDIMVPLARRLQETRFKVVAKKDTNYFENIYSNMTKEYLDFYNATTDQYVSRAGPDPCSNQPLFRQMWRDILDNSLVMLRSAARSTIQEHKRRLNSTEPSQARIDHFVAREIMRVKKNQLDLLCDKFQLCFNDLL